MRKSFAVFALALIVATIVLFCWRAGLWNHHLTIDAHFQDVQGLRSGAQVRLAGVPVGVVKGVRADPERREAPAQVVMEISTPYVLRIPSDSKVEIETAGVLGGSYVEIEIAGTHGPALSSGATLESLPPYPNHNETLVDALGKALKPCGPEKSGAASTKDGSPKSEKPRK